MSFWDPRARVPAEGSFHRKDGKFVLTCGKKELPFTALDAKATRTFLSRAKLHDVRWRRQGHGLARDEEGVYYYVDRARLPEDSTDYRVYVGLKGRVTAYPAELLASDAQGEIFSFGGSKLMISPRNKRPRSATAVPRASSSISTSSTTRASCTPTSARTPESSSARPATGASRAAREDPGTSGPALVSPSDGLAPPGGEGARSGVGTSGGARECWPAVSGGASRAGAARAPAHRRA